MKDAVPPVLEVEIPVGLMPLLLARAEHPQDELRKALGVSDQVFHEFCNGRGRLSPMKAHRIAEMARLSEREMAFVTEAARAWKPEVRPKEGATLTHPFRGPAKVRRVEGATVDLLLMPKERPMNGVPLLVFEADFIGRTLMHMAQDPGPAEVLFEQLSEARGKLPEIAEVPHQEVLDLFSKSGLGHISLANLIGISPSVISAHADGRMPMPRARYQRLEAALAKISSKRPGTIPEPAPKKAVASVSKPAASAKGTEGDPVSRETVLKTIRGSGLTNKQIAALLGISDSMVGHYMTGRNKMSEKRHATLVEMLENRHKAAPAIVSADMAAAKVLEKVLTEPVVEKPAETKADLPTADVAPAAREAKPTSPVEAPKAKVEAPVAPPAPARVTSPAAAMLEMLDLVQGSLAELFGGRDLLAQRMELLDQLPAANSRMAIDPGVIAEISARQTDFDRRIAGVEAQVSGVKEEVSGISQTLLRIEAALSKPQTHGGCSVSRLAKLLAAD